MNSGKKKAGVPAGKKKSKKKLTKKISNQKRKPVNRLQHKYSAFVPHAQEHLANEAAERARKRAEAEILGWKLAHLRHEFGIKQTDLENFSQSGVSKIENRKDMKVSTLINYVRSLGLELEIKVRSRGAARKRVVKEVTLLHSV